LFFCINASKREKIALNQFIVTLEIKKMVGQAGLEPATTPL
jgi:hypothetical protein